MLGVKDDEVDFADKVSSNQQYTSIELHDVTVDNLRQLRRLNQAIFPVAYHDKFYKDVLQLGQLAKLAYVNNVAVGSLCGRVEETNIDHEKRLYIMTLGCLAPYRRLGVGSAMLEHLLKICEQDGTFSHIYLHVQVNNTDAIKFYEKFGFTVVDRKENYYRRLEPADAFVLQKVLNKMTDSHTSTVDSMDSQHHSTTVV
jgi:ribosomal protein S18 acetylase RimI-like enzyme